MSADDAPSGNDSKFFSRYVFALWDRAPIDMATYSNELPEGENSNRCGPRSWTR